jgi:TonB family protein
MLAAGIKGWVEVEFVIDTEGKVRDATLIASTHPEFEAAAIDCVEPGPSFREHATERRSG